VAVAWLRNSLSGKLPVRNRRYSRATLSPYRLAEISSTRSILHWPAALLLSETNQPDAEPGLIVPRRIQFQSLAEVLQRQGPLGQVVLEQAQACVGFSKLGPQLTAWLKSASAPLSSPRFSFRKPRQANASILFEFNCMAFSISALAPSNHPTAVWRYCICIGFRVLGVNSRALSKSASAS